MIVPADPPSFSGLVFFWMHIQRLGKMHATGPDLGQKLVIMGDP